MIKLFDMHPDTGDMSINTDLEGRVKNTKIRSKYAGLDPLFEGVVNSIQSIGNATGGKITITVTGNKIESLDNENKKVSTVVTGFLIEDNGVGFNTENYESFCTLDSQYKSDYGCKGIGRLSWLKVFNDVKVESVFEEKGVRYKRTFEFNIKSGVCNEKLSKNVTDEIKTKVTLSDCKQEFHKTIPVTIDTISRKLFHYCFSYIVSKKAPEIYIKFNDEKEYVNDIYDAAKTRVTSEEFEYSGFKFSLQHAQFYKYNSEEGSGISLCANGLEVTSTKEFSKTVFMNEFNEVFKYRCYVSSPILDEYVNNSRDGFDLPDNERSLDDFIIPSLKDIKEAVIKHCNQYLENFSENYRKECRKRCDEFNKIYGKIFTAARKYDEGLINRIRPDMTDGELYEEYNKSQSKIESKLLFNADGNNKGIDDYALVNEKLEEINAVNKDNLVKYVIHRNVILKTYRNRLEYIKQSEDDERLAYEREKLIHDILLPQGTGKNDVPTFETCNLWMIDERLNHYAYLSSYSDKRLDQYSPSDSDERPDIIVFGDIDENGVAKSIAIIELKRPGSCDPKIIQQIIDYILKIEQKELIDYKGNRITIEKGKTVFYCYAICDTASEKFGTIMRTWSFKPQFGGRGYRRWYEDFNAEMEAIDHLKLVADAEKRNRVFFKLIEINIHEDSIEVTGEKPAVISIMPKNDGADE